MFEKRYRSIEPIGGQVKTYVRRLAAREALLNNTPIQYTFEDPWGKEHTYIVTPDLAGIMLSPESLESYINNLRSQLAKIREEAKHSNIHSKKFYTDTAKRFIDAIEEEVEFGKKMYGKKFNPENNLLDLIF